MIKYMMAISKWLPMESEDFKAVFAECTDLQKMLNDILEELGKYLIEYQKKITPKASSALIEDKLFIEKLEYFSKTTENAADLLNEVFQKLNATQSGLMQAKLQMWKELLWKMKLKLIYYLREIVNKITHLFVYMEEKILELALRLAIIDNRCLSMDNKFGLPQNTSICCNTCPYLMYPSRKISITRLLQILAQKRAEICSHKLIDCLLDTFKLSETHDDDDSSSENSSVEIYKAITKHMSPPVDIAKQVPKTERSDMEDSGSFVNMEELLLCEQQNVLRLLDVTLKVAPNMLGNDTIKTGKSGEPKISVRAQKKALEYYQQILWGEVGNFLEHIILWWGSSPMASRSPNSSQHLREWINQFVPTADVPQYILSALTTLADALGVHVTSTLWDQQFRKALVAANRPCNPETGPLFCDMLRDLVMLCNQFEVTADWIVGAPLDELPLVEQIPVLHRLDHSVHTTRLWAASETKKIANSWNMEAFFTITHKDIANCLSQLGMLRMTDYTVEIEKGGLGVHVEVCANMRAKLVSEVKENIQKLKETPNQCIECLASICTTISLAHLQMIFPDRTYWKQNFNEKPEKPSPYVEKYLNQVLSPVLVATHDDHINNMILKLMCEAWLDHIYVNRIKFSEHGALQLLCDFAYVSIWLNKCPNATDDIRRKMLKNEVLRRCEGVGRLLLRCPGEHVKMNDKSKKREIRHSPASDKTELMPPEMYVPNQEQWLELRANRRRTLFITPLCCGSNVKIL